MVLAAFVQRSTVLSKNRQRSLPDPGRGAPAAPDLALSQPLTMDVNVLQNITILCSCPPTCLWESTQPAVDTLCTPSAGRGEALQTHTCTTHSGSTSLMCVCVCFRYFEAVQLKEQRRQQRLRGHTSYNVENGEFLCPLCECLSNTVIPLLPHSETPDHRYVSELRPHTHTLVLRASEASLTVPSVFPVSAIPVWRRG